MKKARRATDNDPFVPVETIPIPDRRDRSDRRLSDYQCRRRPEPLLISPPPPIHDRSPIERQKRGGEEGWKEGSVDATAR